MILQNSYREDMIDLMKHLDKKTLPRDTAKHFDPEKILQDPDLVDNLWTSYQKQVEEWNVDPDFAIRESLTECLHMPFHEPFC